MSNKPEQIILDGGVFLGKKIGPIVLTRDHNTPGEVYTADLTDIIEQLNLKTDTRTNSPAEAGWLSCLALFLGPLVIYIILEIAHRLYTLLSRF